MDKALVLKLKEMAAAYEVALNFDYCPSPDEAAEYSREMITEFSERYFRRGAGRYEGRRPSEIAGEIISEIAKLPLHE